MKHGTIFSRLIAPTNFQLLTMDAKKNASIDRLHVKYVEKKCEGSKERERIPVS